MTNVVEIWLCVFCGWYNNGHRTKCRNCKKPKGR